MKKQKVKVNIRRLKALSKRVTNKALAQELGISESTFYRYKRGATKKPRFNINNSVDRLWDVYKSTKPTNDNKLKHRREIKLHPYKFVEQLDFERVGTIHYIYDFGIDLAFDSELFINMVEQIAEERNTEIHLVLVNATFAGSDEEKTLSTRSVVTSIDGAETLWEEIHDIISRYDIEEVISLQLVAQKLPGRRFSK